MSKNLRYAYGEKEVNKMEKREQNPAASDEEKRHSPFAEMKSGDGACGLCDTCDCDGGCDDGNIDNY